MTKNKQPIRIVMMSLSLSLSISFATTRMSWGADVSSPRSALSVYQINPWVDGSVLGVAAAGSVIPLFFESDLVHPHPPGNSHDINFLDRTVVGNHNTAVAYVSHVTVALSIAAPVYLDAKDVGYSKTLGEDFIVYAEVLSINTSLSNLARYSVQRPRPDIYRAGADVNDPGEYLSFYSGHAASTFAALSAASMTYNYRYGYHLWPWVVTFMVGTSEAAERIIAGRHYYTDNIVGALVGTTVGIAVPMLHHRKDTSQQVTIVPDATGQGAQLVWKKTF